MRGRWLLLASNLGGLRRLLESPPDPNPPPAVWLPPPGEAAAPVYAWLDLQNGGRTLRGLVTFYTVKLMITKLRESLELREQLDRAKDWIDAFSPLGTCRLWLSSDAGGTELRLQSEGKP